MNPRKLWKMFRAFRRGAPLGDVAVLKVDALLTNPPALAARSSDADAPPDLAMLRALPNGTLGREYARFLDDNRIKPLAISPEIKRRFADRPFALRYTTTHDLHHVLTGFDTGLAGEAGVLAFDVGQGAAPVGRGLLRFTAWLYALLSPGQFGRILRNVEVGLALGEAAKLILDEPLEAWFSERLDDVRARLGIQRPTASGVLSSRPSALAGLLIK